MAEFMPKIEYRNPRDLKPNPRNARTHTVKKIHKLAGMMDKTKLITPLFIDAEGMLLAGHARLEAALELGLDLVPVIVVEHLNEPELRMFMLGDNRIALEAGWDAEIFNSEILELSKLAVEFDLDLGLTGLESGEIDVALGNAMAPAKPDRLDKVPAVDRSVPSISKPGDLWELGTHRGLVGDALLESSMSTLMQADIAHQALVDIPFNDRIDGHVSGLGKTHHDEFAMASGEMSSAEFGRFLVQAINVMIGYIKDGAILMIFMDWRHQAELLAAGQQTNLELKNICVWDKVNGGMGSLYRSQHEFILIFKHGTAAHTNNIELGKHGRYRTNVWRYPGANMFRRGRQADLEAHPTVKPIALLMDAIRDCSKHGEIILDPFAGSGSTLLAAERTGRLARIIEIDPYYMDTTIRRWQQMTGKNAINLTTGQQFDDAQVGNRSAA